MVGSHKRLRFVKRWWPILGVMVILVLLSVLDRTLKYGPHFGYCPADSSWTLRSPHVVRWWRSFEETDAGVVLHEDLPDYFSAIALSFRHATGIRPTPIRVEAWLGHQVLLGGQGGRWGVCVRPGILLHAGLWFHRSLLGGVEDAGIAKFYLGETASGAPTSFYYGWRDGFLVVSPWREYVRGSLDAPAPMDDDLRTVDDGLTLAWLGPPSGTVSVRPEDGLPCRGRLGMAFATENSIRTIPEGLADSSLVFFAGVDGDVLKSLWKQFLPWFVSRDIEERAVAMREFIFERWGGGGSADEWVALCKDAMVALVDVEVSERLPVPEIAVVLPGGTNVSSADGRVSVEGSGFDVREHPLQALLVDGGTIPYAWNTTEGAMMPLLGDKVSLSFAREGGYWLAASQERVMSTVLYHLDSTVRVRWGTSVGVNWEKVASLAVGLRRGGAGPVWRDDAWTRGRGYSWEALARTVQRLGVLRLSGHLEEGDTVFQGFVTRGAGESF